MSPRLFYAVATALLCSAVSHAPPAVASPDRVPCGLLNEIRGSLNDDISAGIDGVRTVIGSPYAVGAMQKRDAEVKLASISHGVHYMQDLNGNDLVPGLAPMLTDLNRASDDMRNAVEALFQVSDSGFGYGFGTSGVTVSLAWPQPSTWAAIDYADQKKNAIYGLVNGLQGSCLP
jgi:hypothetical protein